MTLNNILKFTLHGSTEKSAVNRNDFLNAITENNNKKQSKVVKCKGSHHTLGIELEQIQHEIIHSAKWFFLLTSL